MKTRTVSLKRQANEIDRQVVIDRINELIMLTSKYAEKVVKLEKERLVLTNALEGGAWGKY